MAIDTGFAMAYRKLAVVYGNLGGNDAGQVAAATHAFSHRDRLPELEGDLTAGYYHQFVDYDPAKAAAAYRAALAVNADNLIALNNLAVTMLASRNWVEAESLALRATRIGRGASFFENTMQAQVAQGHFEDAAKTLTRYAEKSPASPTMLDQRARLALAQRDYAAGTRMLLQLRDAQRASPGWQARMNNSLAQVSRLRGKLGTRSATCTRVHGRERGRGDPGGYVGGAAQLALLQLDFRARPDSGAATARRCAGEHPLDSIPARTAPIWC